MYLVGELISWDELSLEIYFIWRHFSWRKFFSKKQFQAIEFSQADIYYGITLSFHFSMDYINIR